MSTKDTPETQSDIAARAMEQKNSAPSAVHAEQAEEGRQHLDDSGMTATPRDDYPKSGAFDAEGQRPVLERSRKSR